MLNWYEKEFAKNNYNGTGIKAFEIIGGSVPIIISAPHSVNHFRNGDKKLADTYTGGISKIVQKRTDCHIICSKLYINSNHGVLSYKQALAKYVTDNNIKLLIDLHGCKKDRKAIAEIGTIDNEFKSLCGNSLMVDIIVGAMVAEMEEFMKQYSKEIIVNGKFKASHHETITNYIYTYTNIPCVQLEINGILRNNENYNAIVDSLVKIIKAANEIIVKK